MIDYTKNWDKLDQWEKNIFAMSHGLDSNHPSLKQLWELITKNM